jgi:uncharacterized membrane protein YcaP (DUF421 family)
MRKELLTEEELLAVIHRQGFGGFSEVKKCVLEPNGAFYVEGYKPSDDETRHTDIMREIEALKEEIQGLRSLLAAK